MLNAHDYARFRDTMPIVSVDLVVFDGEGRILLGLRRNEPARGTWFVPGGRLWKNETIKVATQRLTRTELGIEMSPDRTLGAYHQMYTDTQLGRHFITFAVAVTAQPDQARAVNHDDQHEALRWWDVAALLASPEVHAYTKNYFSPAPWNKIGGGL
jgi:colanic acid biosynthesis protein WcaH